MYRVILKKGKKGERVWEHETRKGADTRAYALSQLHSCTYVWSEPEHAFIVDASVFYGGN